jgi:hypothetical protein
MSKLLLLSLLAVFSNAYVYPKKCFNDTIALETSLLKASIKFASLAYFLDGIVDLEHAWTLLPNWLVNCVPFIVIPDYVVSSFYDLDIRVKDAGIVVEGEVVTNDFLGFFLKFNNPDNFLASSLTFKNCSEALEYAIKALFNAARHAKSKDYLNMLYSMLSLAAFGPQFNDACSR